MSDFITELLQREAAAYDESQHIADHSYDEDSLVGAVQHVVGVDESSTSSMDPSLDALSDEQDLGDTLTEPIDWLVDEVDGSLSDECWPTHPVDRSPLPFNGFNRRHLAPVEVVSVRQAIADASVLFGPHPDRHLTVAGELDQHVNVAASELPLGEDTALDEAADGPRPEDAVEIGQEDMESVGRKNLILIEGLRSKERGITSARVLESANLQQALKSPPTSEEICRLLTESGMRRRLHVREARKRRTYRQGAALQPSMQRIRDEQHPLLAGFATHITSPTSYSHVASPSSPTENRPLPLPYTSIDALSAHSVSFDPPKGNTTSPLKFPADILRRGLFFGDSVYEFLSQRSKLLANDAQSAWQENEELYDHKGDNARAFRRRRRNPFAPSSVSELGDNDDGQEAVPQKSATTPLAYTSELAPVYDAVESFLYPTDAPRPHLTLAVPVPALRTQPTFVPVTIWERRFHRAVFPSPEWVAPWLLDPVEAGLATSPASSPTSFSNGQSIDHEDPTNWQGGLVGSVEAAEVTVSEDHVEGASAEQLTPSSSHATALAGPTNHPLDPASDPLVSSITQSTVTSILTDLHEMRLRWEGAVAVGERLRREHDEAVAERVRAETERDNANSALDAAVRAQQDAEAETTTLRADNDRLRQDLIVTRTERQDAELMAESMQHQIDALRTDLVETRTAHDALRLNHHNAMDLVQSLDARLQISEGQLRETTAYLAAVDEELDEVIAERDEVDRELEMSEAEGERLRAAVL
ncbi:MAG: hypothetical protein M1817_002770 [Caeruleum heppii]|nr:MAG: hypothetical protein M1817_002770 [Caeruleum heppii]